MKMLPSDPDIQTIVARIDSGDLDLQPNFQRGEVWTTAKKRKLIDSILRDWHIPPIHVVVGDKGKQEVLDGQQRLVAIRDFVRGVIRVDGTTWLVFVSNFATEKDRISSFSNFLADFEVNRTKIGSPVAEYRRHQITKYTTLTERSLLRIFSDRSSSRVSDVSSVLFRDVILWLFYYAFASTDMVGLLSPVKFELLRKLNSELSDRRESTEEILENLVSPAIWGIL